VTCGHSDAQSEKRVCNENYYIMNRSIEAKRRKVAESIEHHPFDGHPYYWCGGNETDCDQCNMDHPMPDLHLLMLDEERALLR
jgi:hypothetical protein